MLSIDFECPCDNKIEYYDPIEKTKNAVFCRTCVGPQKSRYTRAKIQCPIVQTYDVKFSEEEYNILKARRYCSWIEKKLKILFIDHPRETKIIIEEEEKDFLAIIELFEDHLKLVKMFQTSKILEKEFKKEIEIYKEEYEEKKAQKFLGKNPFDSYGVLANIFSFLEFKNKKDFANVNFVCRDCFINSTDFSKLEFGIEIFFQNSIPTNIRANYMSYDLFHSDFLCCIARSKNFGAHVPDFYAFFIFHNDPNFIEEVLKQISNHNEKDTTIIKTKESNEDDLPGEPIVDIFTHLGNTPINNFYHKRRFHHWIKYFYEIKEKIKEPFFDFLQ